MLLGGVLSDRISPRDLALVSNIVRAVADDDRRRRSSSARRSSCGSWPLVGVVFGTVDAVFLPAINTLVPRLVPADRLAAANAVMQGTGQLVGTVGPAIAGFAVALVGVGAAFAVDAAVVRGRGRCALWFVRSGGDAGSRRRRGRAAAAGRPAPADRPAPDAAESHVRR